MKVKRMASTKAWIDKNRAYKARILKREKSQIRKRGLPRVAASRMLEKPPFKSLPQEHH
jgi:hypothetical protein